LWQFDEQYEDARKEIAEFGITEKDLAEDGVELRVLAYYPPKAPRWAHRVYGFLRQNDSHVLLAGGMGHIVMGLDKYKLSHLAPAYGIEYDRILPFINLYETEMLKRQQRMRNN